MKKTAFLSIGFLALVAFAAFAIFPVNQIAANQPSINWAEVQDAKLSPQEAAGAYNFDKAHSSIGFRVKHMGLAEIPGYFGDFTGSINYDAADVTKSSVEFTAKATSINTAVARRDDHLRSADFFEVEKYPDITFKSTKIEKRGANNFVATGDFTMKGVTKQIQLPVTFNGLLKDQRGGIKMGFSIETTINRRDYGVNYGSNLPNGTPVLSDDVKINIQVEAAKAAPKPAVTPAAATK
ncbi:MAG: YceI family protein [Acidobacteriota bacterium]|nr:YceI family protein [Acidobacteriota bacterium]